MRKEGLLVFVKRAFLFMLRSVKSFFFSYGKYYIYEKELSNASEVQFKPKIQDCIVKIVSTSKGLDELSAGGYDFKTMNFEQKLRKGALAFCVFVKRELAHVTWVAPNGEAKREIDPLPFKVNFETGEVCSGASFTCPIYRGKGLLSYAYSYIFPYLAKRNILKDKFTIDVNNTASQKALSKFNPTTTGKGHYLKILWWEFWKEEAI